MTGTFAELRNLLLRAGCGFENLQPLNRSGHVLTGVEDAANRSNFSFPRIEKKSVMVFLRPPRLGQARASYFFVEVVTTISIEYNLV
jgi:hypothetical protein